MTSKLDRRYSALVEVCDALYDSYSYIIVTNRNIYMAEAAHKRCMWRIAWIISRNSTLIIIA